MPTTELEIVPPSEASHIDELPRADAVAIWDGYKEKVLKLKATAETLKITDVSQKEEMKLARATRLTFKSLRVEIENRRKELGEEALRRKQKIDAAAKELKDIIEPLETRLLEQEQFVERAEAAAKAELKMQREAELLPLGCNTALYNLSDMTEEEYTGLIAGIKAAHEAKVAAEKRAEEERVAKEKADAEERARIAAENARLKKEAEEREAEMKAAAEKARKEREEIEAKARADREAAEAKAKAERDEAARVARVAAEAARKEREAIEAKARAEREAAEAAVKKEREAREKLEAELKAKQESEERINRDAEIALKKAAQAPDKTKLIQFSKSLRSLSRPAMATDAASKLLAQIEEQIDGLADSIEKQAASL